MNICVVAGGIDDGSRMVTGILGSLVVKFFMASSLKGCHIDSRMLTKQPCQLVNVDLVLTSQSEDLAEGVFRINGSVQFCEQ